VEQKGDYIKEELELAAEGGEEEQGGEQKEEVTYTPAGGGGVIPGEGGLSYDSEWVRFMNQLSKDSSMASLVGYLKKVSLTPRAKGKLRMYITTLLDAEFAVSKIRNREDFWSVLDEKNILDADLPLGLCRFDITPEFIHIIDLVSSKWQIKILRSFGGFERGMLATQRTESISEERTRNVPPKSVKESVKNLWK
jgi:hypothetical protein